MPAVTMDGKQLADRVLHDLTPRVAALKARGARPRLVVISVGDDPASKAYIRGKLRACEAVGIAGDVVALPATVGQHELLDRIDELNRDRSVHGLLVQLPLPHGFDAHAVASRVHPDKDVDGFHAVNLGKLVQGEHSYLPCTPAGVLRLLEAYAIELRGMHAVVIGRSEIVGKPMALLLIERDATVTVCHSRTRDLAALTRIADLVVVAVGKPGLLTGEMIKPGAAVVDIGINRLADGRLTGDVDAASVSARAAYLTPVPGGVGPMTVAMLIENTVNAAERLQAAS